MSKEEKISFKNITKILAEKGISKTEFAAKLGVTTVTLSRWLSGTIRPTYEHLAVMC